MEEICRIQVDVPNAPDLVLDLLAAHGAELSSQVICEAGQLLGHRESTTRVAMTRLLVGKKIRRTARGMYVLDHAGLTLADALNTWSQELHDEIAWRGDWVAVHDAAVTRSDKTSWRRHQLALSLRGFAAFQHGLQLRPCNRAGEAHAERSRLKALGLARQARVFLLSHLEASDAHHASTLWPVQELSARYKAMRDALTTHLKMLPCLPREKALKETLLLGRAAVSQLVRDPMLPPELMHSAARDALVGTLHEYKLGAHDVWARWIRLKNYTT